MVVFINAFSNKSKVTGKPFNLVLLYEVRNEDLKKAQKREFFTSEPLPYISTFNFGDVVKCKFRESVFLGGQPVLESLELVKESTY